VGQLRAARQGGIHLRHPAGGLHLRIREGVSAATCFVSTLHASCYSLAVAVIAL
jgi:hypothetical protein